MSYFLRFVQRYPVFKFLPIRVLRILIGVHFNFPLIPLYILFGIFFLVLFTRYFQITSPIIVLIMPILAMQAGDSQNNSALPTGEVLIETKVEDIQKNAIQITSF